MPWNEDQYEQFNTQGYLFVPGLFSGEEVDELNAAVPALLEGDEAVDGMHRERERSGAVRQIYLAHRHCPPFERVSECSRIVEPVRQILQSEVYIWHSKINVKDAFEGTVWLWHQDYGY